MTTVTERLFDNSWYVSHAAPGIRDELAAEVTRTWMLSESAREDAARAKATQTLAPGRYAVALSHGSAARAAHDRARTRVEQAARCTDIVFGHAFCITRSTAQGAGLTVDVASCTLARRVRLTTPMRGSSWTAELFDPRSRWGDRELVGLDPDLYEATQWACEWVLTGARWDHSR